MAATAKKLSGYLMKTGSETPSHVTTGIPSSAGYVADKAVAGMFMGYNTSEHMGTDGNDKVVTHVVQYDNKMPDGMKAFTDPVEDVELGENPKLIAASAFSSNTPKVHETTDGMFMVRGTYDGADGEYRCTAGTDGSCISRAGSGGGIDLTGTGNGGGWIFDPDAGEMRPKPDDKYATFGWWLNEAPEVGGANVGTFYDAATLDATTEAETDANVNVAGVTGTATYDGIAVGKAALNAVRGDDNIGGAFTADASLTATFGASMMLEGEITDFMIGDEERDWTVKLNKEPIGSDGTIAQSTGNTVWSIDGVKSTLSGGWQAQMYDQAAPADGEDGTVRHHPKGVTGGFSSQFVDGGGHMVGAFGAESK